MDADAFCYASQCIFELQLLYVELWQFYEFYVVFGSITHRSSVLDLALLYDESCFFQIFEYGFSSGVDSFPFVLSSMLV